MKPVLFGKNLDELTDIAIELGLPKFTGRQLAQWLYQKEVTRFADMTNLSKKARDLLEDQYEIGLHTPAKVQTSQDGTKKYLFPTDAGKFIETAMIPKSVSENPVIGPPAPRGRASGFVSGKDGEAGDIGAYRRYSRTQSSRKTSRSKPDRILRHAPNEDRVTVCVSSQIGCKMGCLFCMTGKQGFQGQLNAGEIVNQVRSLAERHQVTNLVYMGMGEPFDNLDEVLKSIEIFTSDWGFAMSPRRITVSSVGITPGLIRFLQESEAHLAISVHTPFHEERQQLMPVQIAYPLEEVIQEIRQWDFSGQRRVSFEYIVFHGFNDTARHVKQMSRLLQGIRCRINLIRFHPIPGSPLEGTDEETLVWFRDELNKKGITTTVRVSRGLDIYAACGLLSTKAISAAPLNAQP